MAPSTSPSKGRWRVVRRRLPRDGTADAVARAHRIIEDLKLTGEALRRSQTDLAESRRELQLTIDTIPALVARHRADGVIEFVNQMWHGYTGLSHEFWKDRTSDALHPDERSRVEQAWLAHLPRGGPFETELRLRSAAGEYRWHVIRRVPLRDDNGDVVSWYSAGYDIEDRKRVESALHRSEAYLLEAQKLSHTGSFGWNVSSGEIFWSEETYRIFGYESAGDVTMDMVLQRVHPDDRALVARVIDRAATHKEAFDFEHRLQMPDGSVKHLHVVAHALIDEPQNLQFAGAVMDVTASKETEQALRHSESRYQNLFQAMAVSFFEVDYTHSKQLLRALRDAGVQDFRRHFKENPALVRQIMRATRIVDVNDQTVALFGRGSKDELLTSVEPFWPEESLQDYVEAVLASIGRNQEFSAETRMRRFDGTIFDAHFTLQYASEDKTRGLAGVIDITARKQAFSALEKSEKRYQDLFQAMAVSFWEVDYTRSRRMLRAVRDTGVVDFRRYFRENPAFARELMQATHVANVNDHTIAMFGQGSKEELLRSILPFWPDESLPDYVEAVLASIELNQDFSTETRLRRRDGTLFDAHFTMRYASEDKTKGLAGIIDITARKQAFLALERSEQRYRHLFHHMPVALWQLNARGVLELFKQLRSEGVTDLGAHFDAHPALLQRCMEMLIVEEVNEHTVHMLGGRDTSEFVGTSIARYFPEHSPTFRRSMVSRYRGDPNYAAETKLFTLDGRVVDVLYTASRVGPISEPGMSLLGVIDITERKKAEEALRLGEQRYQNLFQAMAVSLWELDYTQANDMLRSLHKSGVVDFAKYFRENPDAVRELLRGTRVVDVNDQTVELFGCGSKKEELLTTLECYLPEESWESYIAGVVSSIGGNTSFSTENRFRKLDGTLFDGHVTIRYAPESKVSGLAGVIDITARKQAFLALEKSEQRYRHLFQNMPVALWQVNAQPLAAIFRDLRAQGVTDLSAYIDDHSEFLSNAISALMVEEVNDYTVQLFGARNRNELLGPAHWTWGKSLDTFRRAMESSWRGEESFQETTKLLTRDGRVIDVLYTSARPQTIEGLPIRLISVIDLTEQVRTQDELQRVRADFAHAARVSMLGELTASIAHEVNQPLAAIAAGGEASLRWLARPTPDIDEIRDLTKRVAADARRASEIISRVRAMATRRVPEPTLLSLDDVIREALLFLHHEVESRGVAVSHLPALGARKVFGDRTQLQQVIVNLAVNAMQSMAQAGSTKRNITIRAVADDPATLRCSVEDSGPGIEPQHVTRLFDSFFTTKDGGMGMGLRICRSVIDAHGGRIAADNKSPHGGARFFFTLPITDTAT